MVFGLILLDSFIVLVGESFLLGDIEWLFEFMVFFMVFFGECDWFLLNMWWWGFGLWVCVGEGVLKVKLELCFRE